MTPFIIKKQVFLSPVPLHSVIIIDCILLLIEQLWTSAFYAVYCKIYLSQRDNKIENFCFFRYSRGVSTGQYKRFDRVEGGKGFNINLQANLGGTPSPLDTYETRKSHLPYSYILVFGDQSKYPHENPCYSCRSDFVEKNCPLGKISIYYI